MPAPGPNLPLGPALICIGIPSPATVGGPTRMVLINEVEEVRFSAKTRAAFAATALSAGAPVKEGIYALPPNPEFSARINDAGINNLALLFQYMGGEKKVHATDVDAIAVGFGGNTEAVVVPSMCIIPSWEKSLGVAAPNALWFPGIMIDNLDDLLYNRAKQGESNNPISVNFKAVRAKTDAAGTTMPERFWYGWLGQPKAVQTTTVYNLPVLTGV